MKTRKQNYENPEIFKTIRRTYGQTRNNFYVNQRHIFIKHYLFFLEEETHVVCLTWWWVGTYVRKISVLIFFIFSIFSFGGTFFVVCIFLDHFCFDEPQIRKLDWLKKSTAYVFLIAHCGFSFLSIWIRNYQRYLSFDNRISDDIFCDIKKITPYVCSSAPGELRFVK